MWSAQSLGVTAQREQIQQECLDRKPPGCLIIRYPGSQRDRPAPRDAWGRRRRPACGQRLLLRFVMLDFPLLSTTGQTGAKAARVLSSFSLTLPVLRLASPRSEHFFFFKHTQKKRLSEKAHSCNLPKRAHFNPWITEAPNYPQTNTLSPFKNPLNSHPEVSINLPDI